MVIGAEEADASLAGRDEASGQSLSPKLDCF